VEKTNIKKMPSRSYTKLTQQHKTRAIAKRRKGKTLMVWGKEVSAKSDVMNSQKISRGTNNAEF